MSTYFLPTFPTLSLTLSELACACPSHRARRLATVTASASASSGVASATAAPVATSRRGGTATSRGHGIATIAPPANPKKRERAADGYAANDGAEARAHESAALAPLPVWASVAALEGELERTLKRRRLQCQECLPRAHGQANSAARRLRLVLASTLRGCASMYTLTASDVRAARSRAHATLRLSAHVLDDVAGTQANASAAAVRVTSLFRAVTLMLVDARAGGAVMRVGSWRRSDSTAESDAFELTHALDDVPEDGHLVGHALVELDTFPARYAPSAAFAQAMRYTAASITKVSAVLKVWEYCKAQRLVDGAENITADATLAELLGVQSFSYADVPGLLRAHLLPLAPLHLALPLHAGHHERWAEAVVDVPIPQAPFDAHRNLEQLRACEKRVREALAEVEEHRARRHVLAQFAEAPVAFLEDAMLTQTRGIKQALLPNAHGRDAEDERSAHTYLSPQPELNAAVVAYLESRT